jgi:phosphate-selective porin OprO/OprP
MVVAQSRRLWVIAALACALTAGTASGQGPPAPEPPAAPVPLDDAVKKLVGEYLKAEEGKKKQAEEEKKQQADAEGRVVGSDLKMTGAWTPDGLFFRTANDDFALHFGGRFQFDSVWWAQPQFLKGSIPGNGGLPASKPGAGVGPLDDGSYFRRLRLRAEGTLYETYEFLFEPDFENLNRITLDYAWVGARNVPWLGTVRVGQHKVPQGLESYSSSRFLELMERSPLIDTFWQEFGTGLFASNTFCEERATWAAMVHRIQTLQQYNGADFGDGDYAATGRVSVLPVYEAEGRCLVHLAGSYQWRHADLGRTTQVGGTGNDFADTQHVVRFRDRPAVRDAVSVANDTQGDPARFIDTGFLLADNVHTVGSEFLALSGPFHLQAEATFAAVDGARSIYPAADFNVARGTPVFWGAYAQAGWFLTGESRGYNRRFGTYDRVIPNANAFVVRDEDGRFNGSCGAWELVYRAAYADLNANGIAGGILIEHTVGLNWYLTPNVKFQANYLNADRHVVAPANSGTMHGFGLRAHIDF